MSNFAFPVQRQVTVSYKSIWKDKFHLVLLSQHKNLSYTFTWSESNIDTSYQSINKVPWNFHCASHWAQSCTQDYFCSLVFPLSEVLSNLDNIHSLFKRCKRKAQYQTISCWENDPFIHWQEEKGFCGCNFANAWMSWYTVPSLKLLF